MKLRLPLSLFRAVMACFAAFVTTSLASASSASSTVAHVRLTYPDTEQESPLMCWAASAADILAIETGADAASIYRSITEASGNTPGYVESALSWYREGAEGRLDAQAYDARHAETLRDFDSLETLASALQKALGEARAVAVMLYADGERQGMGHAVTAYASRFEGGKLYLSYVDSADGVPGMHQAEVVAGASGLLLADTGYTIGALSYLDADASIGEEVVDEAPGAPVGSFMHSSPLIQEYTDMAENRGVYRFGYSPSAIMYQNGEPVYTLELTPDYNSVADMGCYTLIDNGSYQITVNHNGMMSTTFTSRFIGHNAQHYTTIGIRGSNPFVWGASNPFAPTYDDYKLDRISRLVTDSPSSAYCTDIDLLRNVGGMMHYRVGAGTSGRFDSQANIISLTGAWGYGLTAGIAIMSDGYYLEDTGVSGIGSSLGSTPDKYLYCSENYPLPTIPQGGDSGSPCFIYNAETKRFELVGVLQGGSYENWGTRYNASATEAIIDWCDETIVTKVDYSASDATATTYYIHGARIGVDDELVADDRAAAYLRKGQVTLGNTFGEQVVASYNGVALEEFAQGTWKLMDADRLDWYVVDDRTYLNAEYNTPTDEKTFGVDDLFYTNHLLFVADSADGADSAYRRIELAEAVDLGIGRVQFSLGSRTMADGSSATLSSATFDIGRESSGLFLSSAGFVVDKGVTLNNFFTYEKGRELRRTGEGTMNIVGTGNSDLLLNIGGGGVTYLDREGGYAALSVLVNNKAVLRLADVQQVYNNVTLGANGGIIDFNGNDYRWTSGGARRDDSFGLTLYEGLYRVENSYVVNYAQGSTSTITIERGDDFEFAGAFRDGSFYSTTVGGEEKSWDSRFTMMPSLLVDSYTQFTESQRQDSSSVLRVIYDGHATMTMTGVYTMLTGSNAAGESGFEVASGTVQLRGTNTIHALGSESGTNRNRYVNEEDWHYAMAEMDVKVGSAAAFELGDHALLIGNVQVEAGGNFVMKQAVNKRYEYVEGWYEAEDTYALSAYYGLKGNVALAEGARMDILFDEGVATRLDYAGNNSGSGSLRVDVGEGSVYLAGQNTLSGEKTVASGYVHLAVGAEGDTSRNKWLVEEKGALALEAVKNNADVQRFVHEESRGVLALTSDFSEQLSPEFYPGLIVGAAEGREVHYGSAGLELKSTDHCWTLGGGGGTLYVDFLLRDNADGTANKLVLGNEYGSGTVVLTHAGNSFSGGIDIVGNITLEYTDVNALGGKVGVTYGNVLGAPGVELLATGRLDGESDGVFALTAASMAEDCDLTQHQQLALAAKGETTLTGALTLAEGAAYRFGGSGRLTLDTLLSGAHGMVVDGQGTVGSRVILAQASEATGMVKVQGYDSHGAAVGDVTLSFTVNDALASASSLLLRDGAIIELNGTSQLFNALEGEEGSLIADQTQGGNTLTLHYGADGEFAGRIDAAGTDVVKTGAGTLTLSGSSLWRSFTLAEGTVAVSDSHNLGYIATGGQAIDVNIKAGATLHVTKGVGFDNTFHIAGFGSEASPYAIMVSSGTLNNRAGALHVEADAAIRGNYAFKSLNLDGHTLTVAGGDNSISAFNVENIVGGKGTLILDRVSMSELVGSQYDLVLKYGSYTSIDRYSANNGINIGLDGGTFFMSRHDDTLQSGRDNDSHFRGSFTVGEAGGTISNHSQNDKALNLSGPIAGEHSGSTLTFTALGWQETVEQVARDGEVMELQHPGRINVSGLLDHAGHVNVTGAALLRLAGDASIGGTLTVHERAGVEVAGKTHVGALGSVSLEAEDGTVTHAAGLLSVVSGGELHLSGGDSPFTFGGTLRVEDGALFLHGRESGSLLGSIDSLQLGDKGMLTFSNLGAYMDGDKVMLHVKGIVGTGGVNIDLGDISTLNTGTYHLLSSESDFGEHLSLISQPEFSRIGLALQSAGTEGAYTLDLIVSGKSAGVTWQGTGTLEAGVANADNITTNLEVDDHSFRTFDSLTITTASAEAHDMLTLGSKILASSVTYAGAGTVTLGQASSDDVFDPTVTFTLNATGTLDLGSTAAVTGHVVMQQGTLRGQAAAFNAMKSIQVMGDASLALTDASAMSTHIAIDAASTLHVVSGTSAVSNRNFSGTVSGSGSLELDCAGITYLTGDASAFTGSMSVNAGTLGIGNN